MTRACVFLVAFALIAPPVAAAADPVVRTSTSRSAPQFGDTFTYTVDATVDPADADSTVITTDIGVLTRIAAPVTRREEQDGATHVTLTERLACLSAGCVQAAGERLVTIPRPHVRVGAVEVTGPPFDLIVTTRVPRAEVASVQPDYRRPSGPMPMRASIDPGLLEAILVAAGGLLLVAGVAGLLLPLVRRRTSAPTALLRADALRRALRLLRESTTRPAPDRRRAASHVARLVTPSGLSSEAARIAWSRPEPVPPDLTTLADRVERETGETR